MDKARRREADRVARLLISCLAIVGLGSSLFDHRRPAVARPDEPLMDSIPTIVISSDVACPECDIVIDTIASVRLDPPKSIHYSRFSPVTAVLDRRGHLISWGWNPNYINVFAPTGEHLGEVGRELYRRGYGFSIGPAIGDGDTLYTVSGNRIAVYEPSRYKYLRKFAIPGGLDLDRMTIAAGGRVVSLQSVRYAALLALPSSSRTFVLVFDRQGRIARRFEVGDSAGEPVLNHPRSDPVADHLWVGVADAYAPTLWSLEGKAIIRVIRKAAWFPKRVRPQPRPKWSFDEHRPASLDAIWEDSAGLLWTLSSYSTAHRTLRPSTPLKAVVEAGMIDTSTWRSPDPPDIDTVFSVVEVIDVKRGVLVASKTMAPVDRYGLIRGTFSFNPGDAGIRRLIVTRFALKKRDTEGQRDREQRNY